MISFKTSNRIKYRILQLFNQHLRVEPNLLAYVKKTNGAVLKKYNDAYQYTYPQPKTLQGTPIAFPPKQKQIGVLERHLMILENIKLHTQEGYIQLPNNKYAVEVAWAEENMRGDTYFNKLIKFDLEHKQGVWYSTLLFWSYGYYEWMCDVLPRFYLVLNDLPPETKIIIPGNAKHWQIRSLELLGIPRERMVEFTLNKIWKLDKMYFSHPVAMTGDHMHEATQWASETVVKNLNIHTTQHRKFYISRSLAKRRCIVNEPVLIEYLEKHGFEIVHTEKMSFDEQVVLFNEAALVVAPHGAGLTNLLFSKAGTRVLEIFEPITLRRCFWTLSNAKKIDHTCYVARTVPIELEGEADIEIDIEDFKMYFESWLNNKTPAID